MFELVDNVPQSAVIKVIGVGGGGGNAVNHMIKNNIEGVEFICANTDAQALKNIGARTILQLGTAVTKGLGAGTNPDIGRKAAIEDRERIAEVLEGADMVFALGERKTPFLAQDFLMSFSLPNFHFHATTTYGHLRALGAPLGKRDYMGRMRAKA